MAWPLIEEAREAEERNARSLQRSGRQLGLWKDMDRASQDAIDKSLSLLGTLKDARLVMDTLIRRFGADGENPVQIPARELRVLLECETDEKGHSRVEGALESLRRIEFGYDAASIGREMSGKAAGYLVSEWHYQGRGPGKHTDGDFYIYLSELALGCLRAFKTADARIRDARKVFVFDFSKTLEDKSGLDYIRGFSALAPYYDRAKGFTPQQRHLRTWIETWLTRRKDGTAKGREHLRAKKMAEDADEPRLYDSGFCPLLIKGKNYHGALGHWPRKRNAETGRKLKGRPASRTKTGGAKSGGLLDVMGYSLLPGRADAARTATVKKALEDLRAVVEEALGGVVAGKMDGRWLSLEEASKLPVKEILEVAWFLFIPSDWQDQARTDIEDYHAGRLERGETDLPVKVTIDRQEYTASLEDRGAPQATVGLSDLRHVLRATRLEKKLSQAVVGQALGVSAMTISKWEKGPDGGGAAIPGDRREIVLRWVETGEEPSKEELSKFNTGRRRGKRKGSS